MAGQKPGGRVVVDPTILVREAGTPKVLGGTIESMECIRCADGKAFNSLI